MSKKIKVVWICHFSNDHIQEILQPRRRIDEFAPWISNFIKVLQNKEDIDLHIISPHRWISRYKTFHENGITYHFFNPGIPFYGKNWPFFFPFDRITNYFFNKRNIAKIVNRIEPEIIHLIGAENSYYSSSIFQFRNKYPVLVTIQGFTFQSSSNSKHQKKRIEVESKILRTFNHFGYRTIKMGETILSFNSNAKLHWHQFPIFIMDPLNIPINKRKFDCVFFARVCKDKGIEDLLDAISLIKKKKEDISLLVIGPTGKGYWEFLKEKCVELDIEDNIIWAGFLPTQKDLHIAASSAKISVLPTYYDIIPGTIIESMFLKIPVIAYDVGSIHELNKEKEHVILVEKLDIIGLAEKIFSLLQDEKLLHEMAKNGFKLMKDWFDNSKVYPELMSAYKDVIDDFDKRK